MESVAPHLEPHHRMPACVLGTRKGRLCNAERHALNIMCWTYAGYKADAAAKQHSPLTRGVHCTVRVLEYHQTGISDVLKGNRSASVPHSVDVLIACQRRLAGTQAFS